MVNHILKHDGKNLAGLFKNLKRLAELNQLFAQFAGKPQASHASIVGIQNGSLIIIADNGSWATQLRFHIPDLLEKFRPHPLLHGLKSITCKTRPDFKLENAVRKRKRLKMKKISAKVSEAMLREAEKIQDEKLRRVMQKIASQGAV